MHARSPHHTTTTTDPSRTPDVAGDLACASRLVRAALRNAIRGRRGRAHAGDGLQAASKGAAGTHVRESGREGGREPDSLPLLFQSPSATYVLRGCPPRAV